MSRLVRTYGVYPNGDWKRNAVDPAYLQTHIKYNKDYRPGRALVVDGQVILPGSVPEAVMQTFLAKLPELDRGWDPQKASIPYQ